MARLDARERHWRELLLAAPHATQESISRAFAAMARELVRSGHHADMSDAAESLVAAIYRYTVESQDTAMREKQARHKDARAWEVEESRMLKEICS
jgi:hypothetical protein